jgi:two-component system OmpR family sensor kinase
VGDASHELRTPVAAVRAYAELYRLGADERPEDLARLLARIEEEAARMGVLVDDLLLLTRLEEGRPLEEAAVDLGAVAADAVAAARALEPERPIGLDVAGSVEVLGDRDRLRQVVDNLLANVRAPTPAPAPADVRVRTHDGRAVLEVADRGPGLDPEQAAHAFERFYRADPSRSRDHGGVGLGLSIVEAIVAAHGGQARVAGRDGGGAVFSVELPPLDGPGAPSA